MTFEEQVRRKLTEIVARDGYVCVDTFADWCVDQLMTASPEAIEAVLKGAFVHFVTEALEQDGIEATPVLDEIFIRDKNGETFSEYIIKKGDESSEARAKAHHDKQAEA